MVEGFIEKEAHEQDDEQSDHQQKGRRRFALGTLIDLNVRWCWFRHNENFLRLAGAPIYQNDAPGRAAP